MLSKRSLVGVRLNFHTLAVLFFILIGTQAFAADPAVDSSDEAVAAGKAVFNANCKTCHKLDQKLIGPALRGATDRAPIDKVKSFIKNSQAVIASGDAYYSALFKEFNNTPMVSHEFLTDADLNNLLAYIEHGDKVDPAAAAAGAGAEGGVVAEGGGIPNEYLTVILGVLVVVLLLILVVLGLIISQERHVCRDCHCASCCLGSQNSIGWLVFRWCSARLCAYSANSIFTRTSRGYSRD